ncbi:DUF4230 domain-containing protein [Kitasatospora sp. NBC_01287]|uniref:DUF4230 domain-containing protein n=1 Tax=Kitasatospora sp. NBC_01287 TaxID=2903573 RepID=UPI0022518E3B|nr:DUF4230 domain-containing protein [Kitasatospora sp. NBC_01287]MCX4749856.1 DUF4230 domain-containing protein [Kitasatospora sp. NBC_01287]
MFRSSRRGTAPLPDRPDRPASDPDTPASDRGADREPAPAPAPAAPARRRVPWYVGLPVTLAVITALFLAAADLRLLPGLPDPFAERTTDRSQPVLLKSIQDMSHYTSATGNFQLVVDLDQEAKFLPSALLGHRTLYVAAGTVEAYVDLGKVAGSGVTVSADRRSATLVVPHAQLGQVALDSKRSYVYSQERGLFDRIGDFLSGNPGDQQQVERLATRRIASAAQDSGLLQRAEQNTRDALEELLRSLGFSTVNVRTG